MSWKKQHFKGKGNWRQGHGRMDFRTRKQEKRMMDFLVEEELARREAPLLFQCPSCGIPTRYERALCEGCSVERLGGTFGT